MLRLEIFNWEELLPKPPCTCSPPAFQNCMGFFPKLPILAAQLLPKCQSFWLGDAVPSEGFADLINDLLIMLRPLAVHFNYEVQLPSLFG